MTGQTALVTLLLGCGMCMAAEEATAPIEIRLASPSILSGDFVQEKTIQGLKKPLRSTGDFLVVRNHGVIWRVQKPFSTAVVITPKGIWSLTHKGADITREVIHQGNLGLAMDMIQKVLAGDPAALTKVFAVVQTGNSAAWTMDLKPLDPVVANVILSIHLQGGIYVDHVEYLEANGDKTHIDFSAMTDHAGPLESWQSAAFHE